MDFTLKEELEAYKSYLDNLAKVKSPEMFTNGGKDYASILMSVLFQTTQKTVRMYCNGFKPDLITTSPYFKALKEYLEDKSKELFVLVETSEYIDREPMQLLLNEKKNRNNDNSIEVRLISEADKKYIAQKFSGANCNFGVFDDDKFRFEYDPTCFKAFGSFNRKEECSFLTGLFDTAFNNSTKLF